ncbi:MAG: NfeD family protein [Bacteroidales bacterium]
MVIDIIIIAAILIVAIFLFILEMFVLPGITFAAVGGLACSLAGLTYAYYSFGVTGVIIALVIGVVIFAATIYIALKSKVFNKLALEKEIDSQVVAEGILNVTPGEIGETISRLNPMGKVNINGAIFEAKSETGFIDEHQTIRVVKVVSNTVIVESCY